MRYPQYIFLLVQPLYEGINKDNTRDKLDSSWWILDRPLHFVTRLLSCWRAFFIPSLSGNCNKRSVLSWKMQAVYLCGDLIIILVNFGHIDLYLTPPTITMTNRISFPPIDDETKHIVSINQHRAEVKRVFYHASFETCQTQRQSRAAARSQLLHRQEAVNHNLNSQHCGTLYACLWVALGRSEVPRSYRLDYNR